MSLPPFQRLQEKVFDTVTSIMGYDATWNPLSGGSALTGRVTFKNPHTDQELAGYQFTPTMIIAEWKKGDFAGLETSFKGTGEIMTINGTKYSVCTVKRIADGQVYQAVLEVL